MGGAIILGFASVAIGVSGIMGGLWVLNRAGSFIEALARWTQEGR
ncbi:MAG TPA: hypothetical protein VHU21_23265 [Paraburkholderia sp.]|nr:hypothetical protein [Paraburkholderia sp.]